MTPIYAFAHFAVDLGCAYGAFSAFHGGAKGFLLYNFFAFALQMPLGLLADRWNRNRLLATLGTLLVAVLCCFPAFGLGGICLLGLGNAMFHIGGGLEVLNLSGNRAAPLGVFVSPGAFGIFLGTLWGKSAFSPLCVLLPLLTAALLMVSVRLPVPQNPPQELPKSTVIPCAAVLFLVVILRSVVGMQGSFPWKTGLWSWVAVAAVVLGKSLGGILSDHFGSRFTALLSLCLGALFFLFGDFPLCGALALLLFNMTMPITLHALTRKMPGSKGFAFGLLTFALFLGFLPAYFGAPSMGMAAMASASLLSLVLLLPALGK